MTESATSWISLAQAELDRLGEVHLYRRPRTIAPIDSTHVRIDGRCLVHFCSNNYLGLTHHPAVRQAATDAIAGFGIGSGAAPLISGYTPAHASAERGLARWKGTQAAVLLPSGYQANIAAVQTAAAIGRLGGRGGIRFLIDKLAHASLLDAVAATGASYRVFPHNGLAKLRRLMDDAPPQQLQVVVTESIFSMDGDAADLAGLARLKQEHEFLLIVDEAHGSGVYGPGGAGLAAELGLSASVDVSIVTLSKAMGGMGGAVCASDPFCRMLVNRGRAYLFSTSMPASWAAAAEMAITVMRDEPWRQERVRQLARRVRAALAGAAQIRAADSPIIPIILGDEQAAIGAAARLAEQGFLVAAVRPPTVPRGSSRLRVTLSCDHTDADIDRLIGAIASLCP